MGKKSDIDKAIANLMKWAERPEWSEERATVFDDHLAQISRRLNKSQEELGAELADYGGMLFGMFIEDLASRRFSPGNRSIVDDYLKRRGWRESVLGRRYLQLLRDSVLSLYEVVEVAPGSSHRSRKFRWKSSIIRFTKCNVGFSSDGRAITRGKPAPDLPRGNSPQ